MEKKIKHLEMLQATIERMGNYSFLIKGWSVTLIAGVFALTSRDVPKIYVLLAFFPALIFWLLDSFYLWQERLFRSLYDYVRKLDDEKVDFSMDVSKVSTIKIFGETNTWKTAMLSRTILTFHGAILLAVMVFVVIILYF